MYYLKKQQQQINKTKTKTKEKQKQHHIFFQMYNNLCYSLYTLRREEEEEEKTLQMERFDAFFIKIKYLFIFIFFSSF